MNAVCISNIVILVEIEAAKNEMRVLLKTYLAGHIGDVLRMEEYVTEFLGDIISDCVSFLLYCSGQVFREIIIPQNLDIRMLDGNLADFLSSLDVVEVKMLSFQHSGEIPMHIVCALNIHHSGLNWLIDDYQ
jgi:hypothetical protein